MEYKALLTLVAAFFILFAAMLNPLIAASIAIGSLMVWFGYLLVTYDDKKKERKEA